MSSAVAAHADTASSHRSSTATHTPITASDDALHSEEKRSPISSKANVITTEVGMVAEKGQDRDIESSSYKSQAKGAERFHRLSWYNLSCVLIVEAIALGALSLAKAYSTIGMVPGVLLTVFLGLGEHFIERRSRIAQSLTLVRPQSSPTLLNSSGRRVSSRPLQSTTMRTSVVSCLADGGARSSACSSACS